MTNFIKKIINQDKKLVLIFSAGFLIFTFSFVVLYFYFSQDVKNKVAGISNTMHIASSILCNTCISENKRSLCLDRLRKMSYCTNQVDFARDPNRVCVNCGLNVISPRPSTPRPSILPATQSPIIKLIIPLSIPVYNAETITFFNLYARNNDSLHVSPNSVDLLDKATVGQKSLTWTGNQTLEEIIALAKAKGITKIAYNLEGQQSMEILVAEEKKFYETVKPYGIEATFAPMVTRLSENLESYGGSFALYTDVLGLQSQRYQLEPNYESTVEDLIAKIKKVNPRVKVVVQVSVNPPAKRDLTAAEAIANIEAIKDKADGIRLFYSPSNPGRVEVMQEVFSYYRQ